MPLRDPLTGQEPVTFIAEKFYLEFDLAVKVRVSAVDKNSKIGNLYGPSEPFTALPQDLRMAMANHYSRAKFAILALLEEKGVPVLDGDMLQGAGHWGYLEQMGKWNPAAVAGLKEGEPISDRFWIVLQGSCTEVCPPPPAPVANDNGRFNYCGYPYASLILRSPVMSMATLDRVYDEIFDSQVMDVSTSVIWEGRQTGAPCTWNEVNSVMQQLSHCVGEDPSRDFSIVRPVEDDRDSGCNTSLRIMQVTGHDPVHVDRDFMPVLQMKKLALFMWFFEVRLQQLVHPRQQRIMQQSHLFPDWARYGPLSRRLCNASMAASNGIRQTGSIEGHLLQDMLKYVPRTMFDNMVEYHKLSQICGAAGFGDLAIQLQLADVVVAGPTLCTPTCLPSICWPVLGFYRLQSFDIAHNIVSMPVVVIGGFESMPSADVAYARTAAQLARRCLITSLLPPSSLQILLLRTEKATPQETPLLLDIMGVNKRPWVRYMAAYDDEEILPGPSNDYGEEGNVGDTGEDHDVAMQ